MAAIATAHQTEQWEEVVAFSDLLAQTWLTRARYAEARQAFSLAQEAARKLEDEETEARNLLRWGEICTEQSNYAEADQYLTESLNLYYRIEEGEGIANAQFELARVAIERSQHDQATDLLSNALTIRQMLGDTEGVAGVMYQLAWISFSFDDLDTTDEFLQRALHIYESAQNKKWLMPTLRFLAQVSAKRGEYATAHAYCQRAHQYAQELQDDGELATLFYTWTIVLRRQSRWDEAIEHGENALFLFRKLGLQRLAGMVLYQLGAVFKEQNELEQARLSLIASIELCRSAQHETGRLFSLILLGDLYHLLDDPEKAKATWLDAQDVARALDDRDVLEELEEKIGMVHFR